MATPIQKLKSFEYLSLKFVDWFESLGLGSDPLLHFNKLKLFKLHFFASAVQANENHNGLLDIFENFHALPYGPVESNVYDNLGGIQLLEVNRDSIVIHPVPEGYYNDIFDFIPRLDDAVEALKAENKNLVRYNALDLVDLSHQWSAWKIVFTLARKLNKFSMQIPVELIKKESKVYSLQLLEI